jgi:hypothetical protein
MVQMKPKIRLLIIENSRATRDPEEEPVDRNGMGRKKIRGTCAKKSLTQAGNADGGSMLESKNATKIELSTPQASPCAAIERRLTFHSEKCQGKSKVTMAERSKRVHGGGRDCFALRYNERPWKIFWTEFAWWR